MRHPNPIRLFLLPVVTFTTGILALFSATSHATHADKQMLDLAGHRVPVWHAGVEGGIPDYPDVIDVTALGAVANDGKDDTNAFEAALTQVAGRGAVRIPPGRFRLSRTLTLPDHTVLRGSGPDTELHIQHTRDAFRVMGQSTGTQPVGQQHGWTAVKSGASRGSMTVTLSDASHLAVGDGVELLQGFDAALHLTQHRWDVNWAKRLIGHFSRIIAIEGQQITLADPVRIDMKPEYGIWLAPVQYRQFSGFEDFRVIRSSANQGHVFHIRYASNIWLTNIDSREAHRSHVMAAQGRRLEVRNSRFHYASDYGKGGHGYGIDLSSRQTGSLIVQNRFAHLRHALVLHLGANGNVVAYNTSTHTRQSNGGHWQPDDLSLHGHYAYSNLIEGNRLEGVSISDHWGPTGPDNVLFRNRIRRDPIAAYDHAQRQIIIGNHLPAPGFRLDNSVQSQHWLVFDNSYQLNGSALPNPDHSRWPDSLFFTQPPTAPQPLYPILSEPKPASDKRDTLTL
ncbi:MAG: hypothetical protein K6L60_05170 [Oceanobacter sp.]